MSKVYTTEITSEQIPSDNPIHQRLLKAYVLARDYVVGDVLEVGCGEGRGIDLVINHAVSYTAIDKIEPVIAGLKLKYPQAKFYCDNIPPMNVLGDNSFDRVLSFQVIEHIKDDRLFLQEIFRILKPGGQALLTTPNRPKSLSRNPWHIREYSASELTLLASTIFPHVEMKGITGNEKVMEYYERNRKSVNRIMRYDIFGLQWRLPSFVLRIPYELFNRWNRIKLQKASDGLVGNIGHADYLLTERPEEALDLLLIVKKNLRS
jgi:2-polyprenyl-3-methyl-5-hydroxy-6-metoxy-1,4-benzoquinol methylase